MERRRAILEDELLSIHSCAIVWQAVVVCHYSAVEGRGQGLAHYSERLAEQAQDLARRALAIHGWLEKPGTEQGGI